MTTTGAGPGPKRKINLGCGSFYDGDFINVDVNSQVKYDVRHDLNAFPYPFADNSADFIRAFHIIEHLDQPFRVMEELHRILSPGGRLHVKVPHCTRGFTHSQHKHGFDVSFPLYFNRRYTHCYFGVDFDLLHLRLNWLGNKHLLPYIGIGGGRLLVLKGIDALITWLANLNVYLCSRIWCYWVGGFDEIDMIFSCRK